jgi:actinin alpha
VAEGKDRRVVLGMVWILISKFAIEDISEEQATAKEGLLLWCKKKTKGYAGCKVSNFNHSFEDGLAFAALIHKHRPDLIDYEGLRAAGDPLKTLNTAFDVAEQEFGICKLLDADDLVKFKPDDKSVMTYVAYYWKAFQQYAQAEVAGRRVANMVGRERALDEKRYGYEDGAADLQEWVAQKTDFYEAKDVGVSEADVAAALAGLKAYQEEEKPPKSLEKTKVEQVYAAFQARLKAEGRPPYTAPAGQSPEQIEQAWARLAVAEREYERACRVNLAALKKAHSELKSFALKTDVLIKWAVKRQAVCEEEIPSEGLNAVNGAIKKHAAFNEEVDAYMAFVDKTKALAARLLESGRLSEPAQVGDKLAEVDAAFASLRGASDARAGRLQAELEHQEALDAMRMEVRVSGCIESLCVLLFFPFL